MIEEGYFNSKFVVLADQDQRSMTKAFAKQFTSEVENEGFTRGKQSFVVTGPAAAIDCNAAFACLWRGEYAVTMLDVVTVCRRLNGKWIPRWTEADDNALEHSEVIILHDLYNSFIISALSDYEKSDLVWFVKDAMLSNGAVIIIPSTKTDADLDLLGEDFGTFVEQHFEVLHVPQTHPNKQSANRRNATSGKPTTGNKRKRT